MDFGDLIFESLKKRIRFKQFEKDIVKTDEDSNDEKVWFWNMNIDDNL